MVYYCVMCDLTAESSSKTQTTNVYCYPADVAEELLRQSDCSSSESSLAPDAAVSVGNVMDAGQTDVAVTDYACDSDGSSVMESFDDFEDFCIIDEPGLGIMVNAAPVFCLVVI